MIKRALSAIASMIWRGISGVGWLIWAILRPAFRFISAIMLLAAVMLLTSDVTRWQVGADGPTFISLADHIKSLAPATYEGVAKAVASGIHPFAWDPMLLSILAIPAWIFFAVFSALTAFAAREPKRINVFIN